MSFIGRGAIDCDVHPSVPNLAALFPYLDDHWRDVIDQRGIPDMESISYPANAPITCRPDWRPAKGKPVSTLDQLSAQALGPWGIGKAILNPLFGVYMPFSEDMGAAFARAVNDWTAKEWLDRDARLRASIVVPIQSVKFSVEEIERCAADKRFVQVLLVALGELPMGRRHFWPIYEAAARHGLPIGIHAGSSYRHAVTGVGWPSYHTEDYTAQAYGMQTQLTSMVCEGVFNKFPDLKVVMIESGFTWLPGYLWRITKLWRGLRFEVPWVSRSPSEIIRDSVRFTLQPVDAPPTREQFERVLEQMGSDRLLLFSTDYPHWQFDGDQALPEGLSEGLISRILVDNPLETYPRLTEAQP